MNIVLMIAKTATKRYLRDKTALFFTFLFPIVFLLVFVFIFKGGGGAKFDIVMFDNSKTEFATNFEKQLKDSDTFKFKDIASEDEAKSRISRGELDGYIILPENFGKLDANGKPSGEVQVRYSQSNEQVGATLIAVVNGLTNGINQELSPYSPPLTVKAEPQSIANIKRFDYTLAGLLGFSLMSLGIFGVVNGFIGDKKTGAIARLRVTPLKAKELIIGTAIQRIFIAFCQLAQ